MAYADAAVTAADTAFQQRVRAAIYAACARIGDGTFVDDQQKAFFLAMMRTVISAPDPYVTAFCWILPSFSGITTASTDDELDAAIGALWPAISGFLAASA